MSILTLSTDASLRRLARPFVVALVAMVGAVLLGGCQQSMVSRSSEATDVLRDFAASEKPIPQDVMEKAEAIAVLHETDAGVVFGAVSGSGLLVQRTSKGWSAPIALDTVGGSFGAQIGGNSREIVLVFKNKTEVEKIIRDGNYGLAEASATAGPAHGAAGDNDNPVETFAIVSGLYVGARVGGVSFKVNSDVNHSTYGINYSVEDILNGKVERPLGTSDFYRYLPAIK